MDLEKKFPSRYAPPEVSVEGFVDDYLFIYDNPFVGTRKDLIKRIVNSDIKGARRGGTPNSIYIITNFGINSIKESFLKTPNESSGKKLLDTLVLAWGCDIRNRSSELVIAEHELTWIGAFKDYLDGDTSYNDILTLDNGDWYKINWKNLSRKGLDYMKQIKGGIPAPDISRFLFD